jgi:tRNA threonylcarbamoyl adenosine modification protein (Sua5/YciO/YrdC/YwlC family)
MSRIHDCSDDTELLIGMRMARAAIARGELVVIPTDTVYGVAADAFSPRAVQRLLDAKGRTRQSPPPVLVPGIHTLEALAAEVPDAVRDLVEAFWPGGLTIVLPAQPSLAWDLGDTDGTVAVRMPSHHIALELLEETGPLAVSSANLTGLPAATTAAEAERMLGDSVSSYLDAGPSGDTASTIVDATRLQSPGGRVTVLREGAISRAQLAEVLGDLLEPLDAAPSADDEPVALAPVSDARPVLSAPAADVEPTANPEAPTHGAPPPETARDA